MAQTFPINLLVIGNRGYVGSSLTKALDKSLFNYSGIDKGYFDENISELEFSKIENYFSQQTKDVATIIQDDVKGFDCVVYLAAISNDPMGETFQQLTEDVNFKHAVRIAKLCEAAGVRKFIFASSCSVYGFGGDQSKVETDPVDPLTTYAKSKIYAEKKLANSNFKNLKVTSLRFATACGPSPRIRLDLVLNDFVYSALSKGHIDVLSDGSPLRPLIDVRDMASVILTIATSDQQPNFEVYNCGSNKNNFNIGELAKITSKLCGVSFSINHKAETDKRSYSVNFDKFLASFQNFRFRAIESTIEDLIPSISSLLKSSSFDKREYVRLDCLRNKITKSPE